MLRLREQQHFARAFIDGLDHHEGARGGKRDVHHFLDLPCNQGAAGRFGQQLVEARVEIDVRGEFDRGQLAGECRVDLRDAVAQTAQDGLADAALRGKPGRHAFHRAPQLDRIADLTFGEGTDRKAAGRDGLDQAFFLQADQRGPDRGAGDAEALNHPQFGDAGARREVAAEDQLPQSEQGPDRLGGAGAGFAVAEVVVVGMHDALPLLLLMGVSMSCDARWPLLNTECIHKKKTRQRES